MAARTLLVFIWRRKRGKISSAVHQRPDAESALQSAANNKSKLLRHVTHQSCLFAAPLVVPTRVFWPFWPIYDLI